VRKEKGCVKGVVKEWISRRRFWLLCVLSKMTVDIPLRGAVYNYNSA